MNLLAIDPGTKCGWAWYDSYTELMDSGCWNLAPKRHEGKGMLTRTLRRRLSDFCEASPIELVVFEDVVSHGKGGNYAAHVYGGIIHAIMCWCEGHDVDYTSVPVGTWKKHATGRGNATKEQVMQWAVDAGYAPETQDEADALGILTWAVNTYGEGDA